MNNFDILTAIVIFITYIVIDIVYALYVIYVEKRDAFKSGLCSSIIYTLGSYGVITFSKNPWYIIPLATGAFLGTFITVKWQKEK